MTVDYVRVGESGLRVSQVGLGMMSFGDTSRRAWHLDAEHAEPIVRLASESGITLFDTADIYDGGASEEITGKVLSSIFTSRSEYVLATKVFYPTGDGPGERGLSRHHILSAVDASLRRLGTDYIDLYQIHRWDDGTPIEETMRALDDLVRAGKVRYLGASTMCAWQFAKATYTARIGGWTEFVAMQNMYNLAYREEEREMIPLCQDLGVGVMPYGPLARGLLARQPTTDRPSTTARSHADPVADRQNTAADDAFADAVRAVGAALGRPPAQVALAWLAQRPGVTAPVIGATKLAHVHDAIQATDLRLDEAHIRQLEDPYRPHHLVPHD